MDNYKFNISKKKKKWKNSNTWKTTTTTTIILIIIINNINQVLILIALGYIYNAYEFVLQLTWLQNLRVNLYKIILLSVI